MGELVNPRERGRQRTTAGALNHRSPARAVHARSCGPSPRRPGRSLRAERLVQQPSGADGPQRRLLGLFLAFSAVGRSSPGAQGRFVPEPWPAVPALETEAREPAMALPEAA